MRPARMKRIPVAASIVLGLGLAACKSDARRELQEYPVTFVALTEEGDAIPGVAIGSAGAALGSTDTHGRLQAQLQGVEGQAKHFTVACPAGFRSMGDQRPTLRLRSHTGGASAATEMTVRCQSNERLAAVLVNAPGFVGLPVLLHGREVARTDAHGTAHIALRGEPRTPMRVTIDTSSRPRVIPASPHKDVRLGARDEVVLFAPELSEPSPPKPKVHRKPKVEEAPQPPAPLKPEELR